MAFGNNKINPNKAVKVRGNCITDGGEQNNLKMIYLTQIIQ